MASLDSRIVACRKCERLCDWREQVAREKRKSFANEVYWGKPVPNFGDPMADRLIVGLAPAAHGANRTGRMFTGDRSGDWLYRALFKAGIANQPNSTNESDGLILNGVLITAIAHCAPPGNKPTKLEIKNCEEYLVELLESRKWRSVLCLGSLAWNEVAKHLRIKPMPKFMHGQTATSNAIQVVASYHPSQQNTFTGRLTEAMMDDAIERFISLPD